MSVNRSGSVIPILSIVLVAAALRLVALDRVPPAICQDEAVNAYDAYSLLKTGVDHYGTPWPVFFRSFGDYHPGFPVYLQIPFLWVMGLNVWSTRLPDALFGTAHVYFLYFLVKRFYGGRVGLLAAGLLAVSPWHIHLSRLAFGIGTASSLMTLGLLLMARQLLNGAARPPKKISALLELAGAGLALGLALWTYHAMRIIVPLLLVGGALLGWQRLRSLSITQGGWKAIAAWVAGFLVGLSPFLETWVRHPNHVWARAASLSLFRQAPNSYDAIKTIAHNYATHFTPSFLFLEGDYSLVQSIPGYGQLHHAFLLFLPLGVYRAVRDRRTERFGLFVLWWILIAPIPASLTRLDTASGHCLRSAGVIPAYDILAALGIETLALAAARRLRLSIPIVMSAMLAPVVAGALYFGYQFFIRYPAVAARYFDAEWRFVTDEIERRRTGYDAVLITNEANGHIGIHYLFWSRMDPVAYHRAKPNIVFGDNEDVIIQIGTTFFASSKRLDEVVGVLRPGARLLVAERPGIAVPGRPLKEFLDTNGKPSVILYDVRTARAQDRPSRNEGIQ